MLLTIINSISIIAILAIVIYVLCFLFRYRVVPQSLSVTAEWSGRYYWWQITICSVMGWLGFYYPAMYPISDYGLWPLLASAGVSGLGLAGYYSYSPAEETKRDITIHKVGSFSGAVLLCLFHVLCIGDYLALAILAIGAILGLIIKGKRLLFENSNSIVFWEEIGIILICSYNIIKNML